MRCRCCNAKMTDHEMVYDSERKKFNDLCSRCKALSHAEYDIMGDKQYEHESAVDGMTPKKSPIY